MFRLETGKAVSYRRSRITYRCLHSNWSRGTLTETASWTWLRSKAEMPKSSWEMATEPLRSRGQEGAAGQQLHCSGRFQSGRQAGPVSYGMGSGATMVSGLPWQGRWNVLLRFVQPDRLFRGLPRHRGLQPRWQVGLGASGV